MHVQRRGPPGTHLTSMAAQTQLAHQQGTRESKSVVSKGYSWEPLPNSVHLCSSCWRTLPAAAIRSLGSRDRHPLRQLFLCLAGRSRWRTGLGLCILFWPRTCALESDGPVPTLTLLPTSCVVWDKKLHGLSQPDVLSSEVRRIRLTLHGSFCKFLYFAEFCA